MALPGPSGGILLAELLLFGAGVAVVGEGVRLVATRWVASWRALEALERILLDLFLGGAAIYLVAAVPLGLFVVPTLVALLVAAGIGIAYHRIARRPSDRSTLRSWVRPLVRPAALLTLVAALGVLIGEVVLASPVGTGNTFDSSLLTLYTARLIDTHEIALSFRPYATTAILYPQGTTAWMGAAQLLLGLPPARTSLLLTPLFFALAPVGGFVFARRWFGSDRAGLAVALMLALVATWTRGLVAGSNDFVVAFPLVLLVAGQSSEWLRRTPSWAEALAFGGLVGYSAALNPVGAEWLLPALLLAALFSNPRCAGTPGRWLLRWTASLAVALVVLSPTWYVLAGAEGPWRLASGSGITTPGPSPGVGEARFVGFVDPYLFRPSDVWLSPVPALRLELAILLTVGLALLLLAGRSPLARFTAGFRTFFLSGAVVLFALLGLDLVASTGFGPAVAVSQLTSSVELSIWLFTLYALVAAVPLILAFEWLAVRLRPVVGPPAAPATPALSRRADPRSSVAATLGPIALVLVIVLPGAAFSVTQLPQPLAQLYSDFGNVSTADFALLEFLGSSLPSGSRLLVAPGSAAEFAPAYAPNVTMLYPMVPGWPQANASYNVVVSELTNGTLSASGYTALESLGVQFIAVTGASTTLWPPFLPGPLLAAPTAFPLQFHEGDAYLFEFELAMAPPGGLPPPGG